MREPVAFLVQLNEIVIQLLRFKSLSAGNYCSFAYSALACFKMGMSGSPSFHKVRKS